MSLFLVGHATIPDKLKVITSAAGDIDTFVSFIDYSDADPPVVTDMNNESHSITTATTTDICAGVTDAAKRRVVKNAAIVNAHASVSNDITVILDDIDASDYQIAEKVTLAPGEAFKYDDAHGWFKAAAQVATLASGAATVSQIAAHSADTYYLGMPLSAGGLTRLQAGSFFRWSFGATKGAAGTVAPTFNIRVGTAGTTADTSRCLMTGTAQTAAADTAMMEVIGTFRVVGASAIIQGRLIMDHYLAITGFSTVVNHHQMVETTGGTFDSTVASLIIGLSVNPGTSGAWVVNQVVLDAVNLVR